MTNEPKSREDAGGPTPPTERWRQALLPPTANLQAAIRCLDETGLQIVMVVADSGQLLGTVTDGDIRRGLLRGVGLNGPIESISHREPLVVPPQWGRETVLPLMQANRVHQLPVVDDLRRVVGLHLWDELLSPSKRPNLMVIMAGGRGARLGMYTDDCPKPLLKIGGKPMLEHIIERASAEGFGRFLLAVHYLGHMIEEYFGNGDRWQVEIEYLREVSPLGTAGALGLLEPRPERPFVVTNGDVLADINYGEILDFHCRNNAAATMAVRLHEWQHPFGVVKTKGVDIIDFEEKPVSRTHINAGIYVLDPATLDLIAPKEACDMPVLFTRVRQRAFRTIVYPMHEPWLDVGRPGDLETARGGQASDTRDSSTAPS